jgi:hypothetical protein
MPEQDHKIRIKTGESGNDQGVSFGERGEPGASLDQSGADERAIELLLVNRGAKTSTAFARQTPSENGSQMKARTS